MSENSKTEFFQDAILKGLPKNYHIDASLTDKTVEEFCRIKQPEIKSPEIRMDMVRMEVAGRAGGVSIKPGNILLNWRGLFGALPGMVLTGVGVAASPWLIILGALVIWKDLYSNIRIELEPKHAIAFKAMWDNHDGRKRILEADAAQLTNAALADADHNTLSPKNFASVVDDLARIGCLKIIDGEIWLREWIKRSWP
ncbi:MAG: hypothetical protein AAF618_07475 [Pseudomonadota bacterium]